MGRGRTMRAVDRVDLRIETGAVVGLVGESGSGKSTTANAILRLLRPSEGRLRFRGTDIAQAPERDLVEFRRHVQMVFQDSHSALNPRKTVARTLTETLRHRHGRLPDLRDRAVALLAATGLAAETMARYPHELSGGQRQRIGIARALAMEPSFIVADEPVSSLDVSLQAQIINLLSGLRAERGLTMLFISHDLALVNHLCDRVAVMFAGRIVETGTPAEVLHGAAHPYTRALIAAVPRGLKGRHRHGAPPLPRQDTVVGGCPYVARCPEAIALCRTAPPALTALSAGHAAACHRVATP
ncbi:MAG: ABC transporter ATP-binding protein [Alphaproteobacteria bacterium]|nr:ABC transporter ATP-binding protein [Alphaproteobacteria bacterium]